ncbi:MAG: hypothetical protein COS82_00095 [Zetaproteobacteria bacterium CG06_land_8_20_14_3_00_59_53]|nr:MAG: hypothetical protein AUK36_04840 [Zetaproteobacteria bacterium CG2_30_59_37]PIO90399.1 MAG: hypothetical protein COX56_01155 [Zetaproteobacteria bacterium CG23_combo_of_CG06-09_8_20_14_all_59_86]PIQ64758.1 MAG: hypothetical protein COV97_07725 [Zetaproteobacteria bacterium CG11_big_fil_rev_8_21_14_0_20_59_439]PIU71348.1 MAG: hypothetical protein COS82_00095 [Zetaproteobacteria bacterium CG06_land_8_20_14_3_00_59_53]PIU97560.1 MAG: hypothetical protein COS62_03260 [Zetaproteobacteria bac
MIAAVSYMFYRIDSGYEVQLLTEKNESLVDLQREVIRRDFRYVVSDLLFLAGDNELLETLDVQDPADWRLVGNNFWFIAEVRERRL